MEINGERMVEVASYLERIAKEIRCGGVYLNDMKINSSVGISSWNDCVELVVKFSRPIGVNLFEGLMDDENK